MKDTYYEVLQKDYGYFDSTFGGTTVPERLKKTALAIMNRFSIGGMCDGMYICNAIARTCGIGDGCFTFYSGDIINIPKVAEYLKLSYGHNISEEDIPELEGILRTGKPDKEKAVLGINKYIADCKSEKGSCDDWRRDYLDQCISLAEKNLSVIEAYC